jgi:hypothetical protein
MEVNVTFGIIVLNGEPFTRYSIRALYPHAHEIIIAEGACGGARNIATPEGHSRDGTLEILREIKRLEDSENKITIVTAEDENHPDGFWPGEKLEQCQSFAKRATGDYLWQVDIDEFYSDNDINKIKDLIAKDNSISCISFKQFSFWGGFGYIVDSWYLSRYLSEIYRIFKWGKGYQYISHRPPTVINKEGIKLKEINFLNARQTQKMGITMYHYSCVFPKQVDEKVEYYQSSEWSKSVNTKWWADEVYYKFRYPYKAFINTHFPGWIKRFETGHPLQIQKLIEDLKTGVLQIKTRPDKDLKAITKSLKYRLIVRLLKLTDPVEDYFSLYYKSAKRKIKTILK